MTMYSNENPYEKLGNDKLSIKDILRINIHFSCDFNRTALMKLAEDTITTTTTTTTTSTSTPTPPKTAPITTVTPENTKEPFAKNPNTVTNTTPLEKTESNKTTVHTTTTAETTTPHPTNVTNQWTIIIGGKVYNLTKFGTPDSATSNYLSFLNLLLIVAVSLCCFY